MHRKNKIKVILCGGGTGGHIFPMISIANELKNENKENEILFVGSRDRMETVSYTHLTLPTKRIV